VGIFGNETFSRIEWSDKIADCHFQTCTMHDTFMNKIHMWVIDFFAFLKSWAWYPCANTKYSLDCLYVKCLLWRIALALTVLDKRSELFVLCWSFKLSLFSYVVFQAIHSPINIFIVLPVWTGLKFGLNLSISQPKIDHFAWFWIFIWFDKS